MSTQLATRPAAATPAATPATRGRLRRRFTYAAAGTLAVLMAVLGVNFANDSGTSSPTITSKAGLVVTPGTITGWNVSVGSAGTVPTQSTIATIDPTDATSSEISVSVYVTNLSDLAANYSSWNFNLVVEDSLNADVGAPQVITSDSGVVSWVISGIDTAETYSVRLQVGGSFYTIGDGSSGSLSPEFFVRASQL